VCYPISNQSPEIFGFLFSVSSFNFSEVLNTTKARPTDSYLGPSSPLCTHFLNKIFLLLFFGIVYNFTDLLKIKRNYRTIVSHTVLFFFTSYSVGVFFSPTFSLSNLYIMLSKFSFHFGFTKTIYSYFLFSLRTVLLP